METPDPENVTTESSSAAVAVSGEDLSQIFGSFKAEWLRERVFDLFTEPSYFPELKTSSPCVLVGGRGTGKTTVLRCLSYEGQFAFSGRSPSGVSSWPFYGLYYRVDTTRVSAFRGPELTELEWSKLFGHFLNLEFCELVLRFLRWHTLHVNWDIDIEIDLSPVSICFGLKETNNVGELLKELTKARLKFLVSEKFSAI